MIIEQEMLDEFNQILESEGSVIRLKKSPETESVRIGLPDDKYLPTDQWGTESYQLMVTDEFLHKLSNFFSENGAMTIHFNNTRSTFWCYD
jgi:hypothetical protein